jgi:hypothetical protein
VHGVWRLEVEAHEKFPEPPLTLIPSYPDLPMEKVYPRVTKTDKAEVYLRDAAQSAATSPQTDRGRVARPASGSAGRVVYFPWDIDRTFWEVLCVDHLKLLRNAVEWATNEEPVVRVTGSGVLDVTAWRQKDSMTVHLVNLTNPMMMKGPIRELIPSGPYTVRVQLPDETRISNVHLLASGATRAQRSGGYLTVTVPSILDHEVVAIDF